MSKQFFPRAAIFGLDINDKSRLEEPRIRIVPGDQSDPASLRDIAEQIGRLDVIIDDGNHLSPHVLTTFETLFPLLEPHGISIVEDLQTSYGPEWQGSQDRNGPDTSMWLLKRLVDGLNDEEFVDDDREPAYTDQHAVAAHLCHNEAILEKGFKRGGNMQAQEHPEAVFPATDFSSAKRHSRPRIQPKGQIAID